MTIKRDRAWVRYDRGGRIVAGSNMFSVSKPSGGDWKEISPYKTGVYDNITTYGDVGWIRYDKHGLMVPGSLILRKKRPIVGYWENISAFKETNLSTITFSPPFIYYIDEGETELVEIATIMATDSKGLPIRYSISPELDGDKFMIDEKSGVLAFLINTDYENPVDGDGDNEYEVVVIATNTIGQQKEKLFRIRVENVNITPTTINLSEDSIDENESIGTTIGVFTTDDVTGDVTYELVSGFGDEDNISFYIDADLLKSAEQFNYEEKNKYSIRVSATNGVNTVYKVFAININNVVELPTDVVISKNFINEENAIGDVIGVFSLVQVEIVGSPPTYGLGETDDAHAFTISGNQLKANTIFDYEIQNEYTIEINATTPAGTFIKEFTIYIQDVNEAPLYFATPDEISINENTTFVQRVIALDPDSADVLSYSIVGGDDRLKFIINSSTGDLSFITAPDYETPTDADGDGIYECIVQATDEGGLSISQLLSVQINDVVENIYYLAPVNHAETPGSDTTGNGTFLKPYATLKRVWDALPTMNAGCTIYMRGGEYLITTQQSLSGGKSGTTGNYIKIFNYGNETPIINFENIPNTSSSFYGFTIGISNWTKCNYVHIKGIEIKNINRTLATNYAMLTYCDNLIVENCKVHHIQGYGYAIHQSSNVDYINCDAYVCGDVVTNYENGNGFNVTGQGDSSTNIRYYGCRSWLNGDDGFDFYGSNGYIELDQCWAYKNGYLEDGVTVAGAGDGNGFKLGASTDGSQLTAKRKLTRCVAANNGQAGFTANPSGGNHFPSHIFNCTAYGNGTIGLDGSIGFFFWGYADIHLIKNNLAYNNISNALIDTEAIQETNSWSGFTLTDGDFVSLDSTQLIDSRQTDGSLPEITFMNLVVGSDLIDGGTNVGIPYYTAPDLGAFEYNDGTALISGTTPYFTSDSFFDIEEGNTSVGIVVAVSPLGRTIVYSISGGTNGDLFTIDANTGILEFIDAPIFGEDNEYDIVVRATDDEDEYAEQIITVTVIESLSSSIISYWKLDETSDFYADEMAEVTLTPNGATMNQVGIMGRCPLFDGVNDYLDGGNATSLNLGNEFSVTFWINPTNVSGANTSHMIVSKGDASTDRNGWYVYIYEGTLIFALANNSAVWANSIYFGPITTGSWQFIGFTYKDNVLKCYINGSYIGQETSTVNPTSNSNNFRIGNIDVSPPPPYQDTAYDGYIDEVGIFSKELSLDEIQYMYNSGNGAYPFE